MSFEFPAQITVTTKMSSNGHVYRRCYVGTCTVGVNKKVNGSIARKAEAYLQAVSQSQGKSKVVTTEKPTMPKLEVVSRVAAIPIVESSIEVTEKLYFKIRESNSLIRWSMSLGEKSLATGMQLAMPAVNMFETPIHQLDKFLCKSLDVVEKRVPSINLPPQTATPKQLKKAWHNVKTRARDAKSVMQQSKQTGEGPAIKNVNLEDDSVSSVLPKLPKVKVVKGSDGPGDHVSDAPDDDGQFWLRKINRPNCPISISSSQNEYTVTGLEILLPVDPDLNDIFTLSKNALANTKRHIENDYYTLTDNSSPNETKIVNQHGTSDRPRYIKVTPGQPCLKPNRKQCSRSSQLSLDELKLRIIHNDLENRQKKFELEMSHLKKMQKMQENIVLLELQYKRRLCEMAEEEHLLKIRTIQKELLVLS